MATEHHATRCPACGRFVRLKRDGALRKHTRLHDVKSGECPMSGRRPAGTRAAERLLEVLRERFWEYYGLAYQEWGLDRDDASAAAAAVEAVRTVSILVVDGQIYLVAESHEVSESAGERQWTVTTRDEGEPHDMD